ncbi:right-handed parallel beta-helix repeat-containing protein [Aquisalinus flavus]|nr:right-handed parallel beta-helix repeat-containing protein [Aquisalinus flavus]MBD0425987.1 right-handed parallel beta-helix repeat-containing protein [Aquisalinus flavus]
MINRRSLLSLAATGTIAATMDVTHANDTLVREFNVAPDGNDENDGSPALPLRTIQEAQRRVREARKAGATEKILIWLAEGIYSIRETLVFNALDAGPGSPLVIRARPGASVTISGGVPLDDWHLAPAITEAPLSSRGKIWVTTLPQGIGRTNTLFDGAGLLRRAQAPAFTHADTADNWTGTEEQHIAVRVTEKDRLRNSLQPAAQGAQVKIIGAAPWTMNYLNIKYATEGKISFEERSSYAAAAPRHYLSPDSVYVENTFAGLTEPGSWVIDHARRHIYLWPRSDSPRGIVVPALIELVRVEGDIQYDLPSDKPVSNIHFADITFTHGDRYDFSGRTGLGLQHDWERFDSSTALVRFRGVEDCSVTNCAFQHSGGTGIRVDLHGRRVSIRSNRFRNLGACAILLAGYGPGTKDVNGHNRIIGNTIESIGELWSHSSGIWAWQSGSNEISHNVLKNLPYTGICVSGRISFDPDGTNQCSRTVRWHELQESDDLDSLEDVEKYLHARENIVAQNDISHVLQKINDGNGIYISGSGHGNLVLSNYIHDCPSELFGHAIRCDDLQDETTISRNLIARFGGSGTGVVSKGRNHITYNIITEPVGSILRGMILLSKTPSSDFRGAVIQGNILMGNDANQPFVYQGGIDRLTEDEAGEILMDRNIYFNPGHPQEAEDHLAWAHARSLDRNSTAEDPGILKVTRHGPVLVPDAVAMRFGWENTG